jgi:hypothetical protein
MRKRSDRAQSLPLSPDGNWFWNGSSWITSIHPNGHWRWTGSKWEPIAQRVDQGTAMTGISVAAGCVFFAVLVFAVGFLGLGLTPLLDKSSGNETTAWAIIAVCGVLMIGLLAFLGVGLALLNRRWWLKAPLVAAWPLYLWILALAANVFASRSATSSIQTIALYSLLDLIGATVGAIGIAIVAAFLGQRLGRPAKPYSLTKRA